MNLFKNELYGLIREQESKLNAKINNNFSQLKEDINSYEQKIYKIVENNKDMVISLVSQKIKLEKISEFENFKNKIDDMIITHELRIKNNLDEICRIKLKYDKIISDNLYVPGFIGTSCQFKNLSEYLSYNISEVSKLKIEKEHLKKEIKDLKAKFEGLMKNMITLNETSVQLCKQYTDNKKTEYLNIIENLTNEMNQKSLENKAIITQFKDNAEKNEKQIQKEFEKLFHMKKEFIDIIDEKYIDFRKHTDELNRKTLNNKLDIEIDRKKLDNINEQIKDLNQSTKDISFQVRNYYCANNKIANLIEKLENLGENPTISEISKLLKYKNEINLTNDNSSKSLELKKKIVNKRNNLTKSAFYIKPSIEEIKTYNNKIAKSTIKNNKFYNKISVKVKSQTSESESESIITDKSINIDVNYIEIKKSNKNEIKNNELMNNKKIKPSIIENIKKKENEKEDNNLLPSLNKNIKEENIIEEIKKVSFSPNERNKSGFLKRLNDINKKRRKNKKIKKSNIISIITNRYSNNKLKLNQHTEIVPRKNYLLEQDKQACKIVTLTLPDPLKETVISKKEKIQKNKFKNDVMNSLINSYRAKLFNKMHSNEEKLDLNNEMLEIPKKITQAFGRTAYTFYFNKEQLQKLNINKNITPKKNQKDNKELIKDDIEH